MSRQATLRLSPTTCTHDRLALEPSVLAAKSEYHRPAALQRVLATRKRKRDADDVSPATFPAPLQLPGDDLSQDPHYPAQSMNSWLRDKDRNKVTGERNVIYIAAPPKIDSGFEVISTWSEMQQKLDVKAPRKAEAFPDDHAVKAPPVQDVVDYLAAFYTGMPVKVLPSSLSFTGWQNKRSANASSAAPSFIGLKSITECVRIRTCPCPDAVFSRQLDLDDLLDAAIDVLPGDAYALLLLVHHDLYEDDDDIFTCGRAYGASRIAVVSMARYDPHLDRKYVIEREHAWPASHCEAYVQQCCGAPSQLKQRRLNDLRTESPHLQITIPTEPKPSPLHAAVAAYSALPHKFSLLTGLWLGRVCRTASHELGHCFGLDHCVYYACAMQGSASLPEDARQPRYLCPVDLAKLLQATGTTAEQRYQALVEFCNQHGDSQLFIAYGAWIRARIEELRKPLA